MTSIAIKNETKSLDLALSDYELNNLSREQLIELAIKYNDNAELESKIKLEIFNRGKDNIQERIEIKKSLKFTTKNMEEQLNQDDSKLNKLKLLASVSLQDRLEIRWIKHDHKYCA